MAREMKDSGIEWIGDIPANWKTDRLQWHLEEIKVQNSPVQSNQVLSLTIESGVIPYEDKGNQGNKSKENHEEYKLAYPDTLVVNSMNVIIGAVGISKYFGCVSPVYYVFRANEDTDLRYIYYIFTNVGFQKEMRKHAKGILEIRLRISASDMLKRIIPVPRYDEQTRISDFLDRKCAEIDAVIDRTRQTVEEYRKLKQSVITETVTRGIRSNRPMRNSGLSWVPQLPAEWPAIPSKFLFRNSDERRRPGDEQLTASQKYGIISQQEYMEREEAKIVLANKGLDDWKHVEPNDFIISLRSFQGGLEMSETTGCITWHYIVLKPCKPIASKYFKWLFKSEVYIKALQRTCNFIRDGQDLRYSNFVQVPLFEPPLDEQQEIADYLDRKCAEFDKLIAAKTHLLEELEAYKKSVIYEYVTGKKEVPAEQTSTVSIVYPYFPAVLSTDKRRFAQAVLMCRILDKCQKKMGRVKLEKMLFTIESSIGFDFETEYVREAAGPLDSSIYECERIISRRNKWYTLRSSSYGVSYVPTKDSGKYQKYYNKYFASYDPEIERIINVFMNYDADQAEIVATLFAAWNDFMIDRKQITDDELVDEVLNRWNDSKKRFSRDVWLRAIEQMRKNNIVPKGYGKRTVVKE